MTAPAGQVRPAHRPPGGVVPNLWRGLRRAGAVSVLALGLGVVAPGVPGGAGLAYAQASGAAALVADRVFVSQPGRLIAEGNVEVIFDDWRLSAHRITFDPDSDRIEAVGPLLLRAADGNTVVLADAAELDRDLRSGLIRSARVVLGQQMQVASGEVVRSQGRYTEMRGAIASSCEICAESQTPLWEIRARRVVHDELERQIHFQGAQFRVAGVPLAYLPHLRVPDPTQDRATGVLRPDFSFDTALGYGLRLPYFIVIDDHRDLTVTPFLTTRRSRTVALRYRHAYASGTLELDGAISRDTLVPGRMRYFGRAEGNFALAGDYRLRFSGIAVRDDAYLADYAFSNARRLTSDAVIERVRRDDWRRVEALHFHSLRPGDDNAILPAQVLRGDWERRFDVPGLGGRGLVRFEGQAHRRPSDVDILGRDVARLSALADWRRDAVLPSGVLAAAGGRVAVDHLRVGQDSTFPDRVTRVTPAVMAELRWPWLRAGAGGATHVIEPVAQVIWSRPSGPEVPNDSARMPEFDEGNLFSYDRFPSGEKRERGLRANVGATWTRHDPAGWSTSIALGRVLRQRDPAQFPTASALGGARSDWLAAVRFEGAHGLSLTNRMLLGDGLHLSRNDLQLDWTWSGGTLSTSVLHIRADAAEDRAETTSEWRMDAGVALDEFWTARVDWRYDLADSRMARTGLGIEYRNECLAVDLSVSRNFGEGGSVARSTNVGLSVALLGIGGSPAGPPARRCAR